MSSSSPSNPWWNPAVLQRRLPHLKRREVMESAMRTWFKGEGFAEVHTPALQVSPGNETHLRAFATKLEQPFGGEAPLYLHTSPEFAMKKLLVAGAGHIYQFARVFRNGERAPTHSPEFTMLEWYRAPGSIEDIMEDTERLIRTAAKGEKLQWQGRHARTDQPFERLSVNGAVQKYCDFDLLETITDHTAPDPSPALLAERVKALDIYVGEQDRFEDIFFRLFLEKIEPFLGDGLPTILYDYPACMAALSRRKPGDSRLAERFEVYVCGLELANAFGELRDAAEQERRFQHDMALKEKLYGERYPIDQDFLDALTYGLPECAGIAMGVDRLAMLVCGVADIEQVLWAPVAFSPTVD